MKKAYLRAAILLLVFLASFSFAGKAETGRKLTLMIYMCGSNLESGSGAASADLEEIRAAGFGPEITVLALAGGSKGDGVSPYFSGSAAQIHEIAAGKSRCVWQSAGPANMGDAETLTRLLAFGREKYPAEEYALILWNHGGGPLEGACWDELFSLDNLSLSEITEGIRGAGLERKLKWIGFDACLMSSLEVAHALAPYAEYMVASQETEPSFGWNYAFLDGIADDATGADTGRRIIDRYFEGHGDEGDVLTLACLDLSKTEEAVAAMDAVFPGIAAGLDESHFARLSGIRMETAGFGKSVRAAGEGGYDLVDALDLVRRMDPSSGSFSALEEKLRAMIVCSRSGAEGANGISLYHPYTNKTDYLEKWGSGYLRLGFCPGYAQYVRAFGSILTGTTIADWKNLRTEDLGSSRFGVQLTPEQAENFGSAQLFILAGGFSTMGEPDDCLLVYAGPAELDGNGMLEASWPERMLFAEKEDGKLAGPVSFLLTDDGDFQVVTAVYTPLGKMDLEDSVRVRYYLREQPGNPVPDVVQTRVLSEVTGTYTNRESFSEDGYGLVYLWHFYRTAPDFEETDPLPAFMDWPVDSVVNRTSFGLPQDWKFRYVDGFSSGEQYFAMFQITDAQQNIYCSRPVLLSNPNLTRISPKEGPLKGGNTEVSLTAYLDASPVDPGLQLFVELAGLSGAPRQTRVSEIVINDTLATDRSASHITAAPGETAKVRIDIPADTLILQETIRSVSFTVSEEDENGGTVSSAGFRFTFDETPNPAWNGPPAVLARAERDGICWELLKAEMNSADDLVLTFRLSSKSRSAYPVLRDYDAEINHLLLPASLRGHPDELRPGQEAVARLQVSNRSGTDPLFSPLTVEGFDEFFTELALAENILREEGVTEIRRIALVSPGNADYLFLSPSDWGRSEKSRIVLEPEAPVPLPSSVPPSGRSSLPLAENSRFSVGIQRLLVGKNGAAVCLRAENRTESEMYFEIGGLEINGLPASSSAFSPGAPVFFDLGPGKAAWITGSLALAETPEAGTGLETVSFTVLAGEDALPVTIRTKTSAAFGQDGGIMLEADQLEAESAGAP